MTTGKPPTIAIAPQLIGLAMALLVSKFSIYSRIGIRRHSCEFSDCFSESALAVDDCYDDEDYTEYHDAALDEVVDGCSFISTEDDVNCCEECHCDCTIDVWYAETHFEEGRYAFIYSCCVRNEEYEGNDRGYDTTTPSPFTSPLRGSLLPLCANALTLSSTAAKSIKNFFVFIIV
jgi:hypothetical protein